MKFLIEHFPFSEIPYHLYTFLPYSVAWFGCLILSKEEVSQYLVLTILASFGFLDIQIFHLDPT